MPSANILLVDDDALLRRSLAFSLGQAGFSVSSAANAEQALAIAAQDRPDLILLDIGLPGMDGLDALRHFQTRMNAPVIILTARDRRLDEAMIGTDGLSIQFGQDWPYFHQRKWPITRSQTGEDLLA